MFDDAEEVILKIVSLTKLCPDTLQEKCFELLMGAYLDGLAPKVTSNAIAGSNPDPVISVHPVSNSNVVPEAIKTRFNSLIARTKVPFDKAAGLFDFNLDPFTYHALSVPGQSNREKMRSLALLLSLKGYLTSANWNADWKEFRVSCIDHGCWDQKNFVPTMNNEWFKSASLPTGVNLSASGIKAAETLFAKLCGVSLGNAWIRQAKIWKTFTRRRQSFIAISVRTEISRR